MKLGIWYTSDMIKLRLGIRQKGQSAKLYPQYIGPFKIILAKPETSTYRLNLLPQYSIHPIFQVPCVLAEISHSQ
jgi:hypothetical protein